MSAIATPSPPQAPPQASFIASVGLGMALVCVPLLASASVVALDVLIVVVVVGLALLAGLAWRPAVGPLLLLATTPLLVGVSRGAVIPYLRLNEAILFVVAGALVLHLALRWSRGEPIAAPAGLTNTDWAIGALVVAGSPLPLLVRFGRGQAISFDDLTHAFVFARLGLLYLVFRYAVRSREEVRRCLLISMVVTVPVALAAAAQSLQLPGIFQLLGPWLERPPETYAGRGPATIGNSIALGDVMAIHLALALTLFFRRASFGQEASVGSAGQGPDPEPDAGVRAGLGRPLLLAAAGIYLIGGVGSGQFSSFVAMGIAVVVVAVNSRRPETLLGLPVVAMIAGIALWPVISRRLEGFETAAGIPTSWQGRIDNLNTFFLPTLGRDRNWIFGVRPDTTIDNDRVINGETFIESGFLWLLWAGGLLLLAAFSVVIIVAFRRFHLASHSTDPWLATAGGAGLAATAFIIVLTTIDPHLTLRGIADVYFPFLAISLLAIETTEAVG